MQTRLLSIHYTQGDRKYMVAVLGTMFPPTLREPTITYAEVPFSQGPVKSYSVTKLLIVPDVFTYWYAVFLAAVHLQSVKTSTKILLDLHLSPQNHLQSGLSWRITSIQALMLN